MKNVILNKDFIKGVQHLPAQSFDIIICDPPYNIGKDFGNNSDSRSHEDYLKWCKLWITECFRVLKPNGTMYIYGMSEILAYIRVLIHNDVTVRWLVWHYTNKATPTNKFWQRAHESILCCYHNKPQFNLDDIRIPYTNAYINASGKTRQPTIGRFSNGTKHTTYNVHPKGALPRDVLNIPALAGGGSERTSHPTQKPLTLCKKLLTASRNKTEHTNLLVPFVGSGSECLAAAQLGITYTGYEINKQYVQLAKKRIKEALKTKTQQTKTQQTKTQQTNK